MAGNVANASLAFTIDLTPPAISNLAPADGGEVEGLTPTITADFADALAGIDQASVTLTVDGVDVTAQATVDASVVSFSSVLPMAPGDHTVSLTVFDQAGNEAGAVWGFSIAEPLAIASIDPAHGTTEGGTWVDVYGSGFTPESDVRFGGTSADEVKFYSSSKLVAVAPAHGAGLVDVTVANPDATAFTLDNAFEYLERLTFNIDIAGGPNATRSNVQEYDVLYGNTVPTVSGTFAGGKPPYQLDVTYYSDQGTTVVIPVDGNAFSADIDLLEGFHYVFVLGADSTGDVTWTAFYYIKDTTGPAAPGSIHAYPTPDGTGATVLWPPSPSMDAVEYELNIRSWSDATGEGSVVSTKTVKLGDVPFGKADVSGLTTGERYTARVTPIDRSGNRGAESDRCIFQALEFFDLHDTKKAVQQKRIALEGIPQALGWSGAFSTLAELQELRTAIEWFNNRSVEDRSASSPQLSVVVGRDEWGYEGHLLDTHWPGISVPSAPWSALPGYVTSTAVTEVSTEAARVSTWQAATGNEYEVVAEEGWVRVCDSYSTESWSDLWSRVQLGAEIPMLPERWGEEPNGSFGFGGYGVYNGDWWLEVRNYRARRVLQFASPPGVSQFFWTDSGAIGPGGTAVRVYPYGQVVQWADPQNSPYWSMSSGGDGVGRATWNIYKNTGRAFTKVGVVIAPDAEYVNAGAAVGVDAVVIYKCAGWGAGNGTQEPWEPTDVGAPGGFRDTGAKNGAYDLGETFSDTNGNGVRDLAEAFSDSNGNGVWDPSEWLDDRNHNDVWDDTEPYTDEDAVFCYIPTPIQCGDQNAFVCNQGGSIFVGFDPGTYTLTTPQGGSGKINVLGVNIEFTDTANTTLNWQDEDLYGGLTPVNDALNPDMSTVKLSAILPPDVTGTFTIRTGPDIELWKGGALFLAANSAVTGLSESQVTTGNFQVRGISVTAESGITLEFWPDGASAAQYADYVKVWTVQVAIENVTTTSTGSPLHVLETIQIAAKEWLSGLPANFNVGKDKLVDSIGAVVWSKCPYLVVKALNVTGAGADFSAADSLTPATADPQGGLRKFQFVSQRLPGQNNREGWTSASDAGQIALKIEADTAVSSATGTNVSTSTPKDEGKRDTAKVVSVEWVGVDAGDGNTNLSHDNPATHGGGYRIFPDKNTVTGPLHDRVKAKATLSETIPAGVTFNVSFLVFDMDDPTQNGAANPVDTTDTATAFNGGDNRNASPGILPAGPRSVSVPGASNSVEIEYQIFSRQPGNNWRVAAFCSGVSADQVVVDASAAKKGLDLKFQDTGTEVPTQNKTELLTAWRKLHVERDSMAAMPATGPESNWTTGSVTGVESFGGVATKVLVSRTLRDGSPDLSDDPPKHGRFENGTIMIGSGSGTPGPTTTAGLLGNGDNFVKQDSGIDIPFKVTRDTLPDRTGKVIEANSAYGRFKLSTYVSSAYAGGTLNVCGVPMTIKDVFPTSSEVTVTAFADIPFRLTDDDSAVLPEMPDCALLQPKFESAFVLPVIDGGTDPNNNKDTVAFTLNVTDYAAEVIKPGAFESRSARGDGDFWIAYVMMAYQGGPTGDGDPDDEPAPLLLGVAPAFSYAFVFRETHRDYFSGESAANRLELLRRTVVHEIGHEFGIRDETGGLYRYSELNDPTKNPQFTREHIRIIRESVQGPSN
ncbi:MAG: hypothetical protein A3K18_10145 [Lentisphaerae bacterium RIFOXYA12_64_32]|nr:MAG: hypothetical protein A3K18_10145 [Lentisphaerae bacterium RIFOXYA12_64_32]